MKMTWQTTSALIITSIAVGFGVGVYAGPLLPKPQPKSIQPPQPAASPPKSFEQFVQESQILSSPPESEVNLPARQDIESAQDPFSLITINQLELWEQDPRTKFKNEDNNDDTYSIFRRSEGADKMWALEMAVQLSNPELPGVTQNGSRYGDIGYRFMFTPNQNGKPGALCIARRWDNESMESFITDPVLQLIITQEVLMNLGQFAQITRGNPDSNAPMQPGEAFLRIFLRAAKVQSMDGKIHGIQTTKPAPRKLAPQEETPQQQLINAEKNHKRHIY